MKDIINAATDDLNRRDFSLLHLIWQPNNFNNPRYQELSFLMFNTKEALEALDKKLSFFLVDGPFDNAFKTFKTEYSAVNTLTQAHVEILFEKIETELASIRRRVYSTIDENSRTEERYWDSNLKTVLEFRTDRVGITHREKEQCKANCAELAGVRKRNFEDAIIKAKAQLRSKLDGGKITISNLEFFRADLADTIEKEYDALRAKLTAYTDDFRPFEDDEVQRTHERRAHVLAWLNAQHIKQEAEQHALYRHLMQETKRFILAQTLTEAGEHILMSRAQQAALSALADSSHQATELTSMISRALSVEKQHEMILTLFEDTLVWFDTPLNEEQQTAFHLAAVTNNTNFLSVFLADIPEADKLRALNSRDINLQTPLFSAINAGAFDFALELISLGVDVNAQDKNRQTPLRAALARGAIDVAFKLIIKRAILDAIDNNETMACLVKDSQGIPAAIHAVRQGRRDVLEHLSQVKEGVALSATDSLGDTALHVAVSLSKTHLALLLLQSDMSFDISNGDDKRFYELLDNFGRTLAGQIIHEDHAVRRLESLAKLPAALRNNIVNAKDASGNTALHLAWLNGNLAIALKLIELGASSALANNQGLYPYDMVSSEGKPPIILTIGNEEAFQTLVKADSHYINGCDREGNTYVHEVMRRGPLMSAFTAVDEGIDLTVCNQAGIPAYAALSASGQTIAHEALRYHRAGGEKGIWQHIPREALITVKNSQQQSLVNYAMQLGLPQFAFRLIEFGANVLEKDSYDKATYTIRDNDGNPLAHSAVEHKAFPTFARLVQAGVVDLEDRNAHGIKLFDFLEQKLQEEDATETDSLRNNGKIYTHKDFLDLLITVFLSYFDAKEKWEQHESQVMPSEGENVDKTAPKPLLKSRRAIGNNEAAISEFRQRLAQITSTAGRLLRGYSYFVLPDSVVPKPGEKAPGFYFYRTKNADSQWVFYCSIVHGSGEDRGVILSDKFRTNRKAMQALAALPWLGEPGSRRTVLTGGSTTQQQVVALISADEQHQFELPDELSELEQYKDPDMVAKLSLWEKIKNFAFTSKAQHSVFSEKRRALLLSLNELIVMSHIRQNDHRLIIAAHEAQVSQVLGPNTTREMQKTLKDAANNPRVAVTGKLASKKIERVERKLPTMQQEIDNHLSTLSQLEKSFNVAQAEFSDFSEVVNDNASSAKTISKMTGHMQIAQNKMEMLSAQISALKKVIAELEAKVSLRKEDKVLALDVIADPDRSKAESVLSQYFVATSGRRSPTNSSNSSGERSQHTSEGGIKDPAAPSSAFS